MTFMDTVGASGYDASGQAAINSSGVAELPIYYFSTTTHTVSASYGGDNSFNSSTSATPVTFTIIPTSTNSTVSASPSSVYWRVL